MIHSIPPPVQKAIDFITSNIDKGTWKTGTKIPASRSLASALGVGIGSISKAIKLLCNKKILTSKEKVGVFIGKELPPQQPFSLERKIYRKDEIYEELKKNILQGRYHGLEFIPSLKELQNDYETSYLIIKSAIKLLVDEKLLKRSKRRFRIVNYSTIRTSNSIYLFMSQESLYGAHWARNKISIDDFVQCLEKECMQKKIRLIKHQADKPLPKNIPLTQVLGFIIWLDIDINHSIINLFDHITVTKKPIAVISTIYDVGKEWAIKWVEESKTNPRLFVSDVTREIDAGHTIGQFLISKGHKHVGYIAHYKSKQVEDHLMGLTKAFNDAGMVDAVHTVYAGELTETKSTNNLKPTKELVKRDHYFAKCTKDLKSFLPAAVASILNIQLMEARFAGNNLHFYQPAFLKLLENPQISTWIFQDDSVACFGALDFLKNKNKDILQQICIMGTYDLSISSMHDLSSYHFDYAGAARKMLNLVIYPEYTKKTLCIKGSNVFTVDGMVIDRGSV